MMIIRETEITEEIIIEGILANAKIQMPYQEMTVYPVDGKYQKVQMYYTIPIKRYLLSYKPDLYDKYKLLFN